MKRRIIFRADGSSQIGYGHFIRTLGIAGLVNHDFNCIFAIQQPTAYQLQEINKVCFGLIELSNNNNHFEEFLEYLKGDEIVVLDGYYFSTYYQLKIRNKGCKVIYIDDYNNREYVCDALINNIPGFSPQSFSKAAYTKLYLGTDYALLREEFFNPDLRTVSKKENSIFISFGGSDILNLSEKIICYLKAINPGFDINLLIGDSYKFVDRLGGFKNLKVHKNINAAKVALLIANSAVCIIPASSLLNEAACVGSKILVGYFTDNQIQPYEYFTQNGLAIGLGDYMETDLITFKDKFAEVLKADYLIDNQKNSYRYQQEENLKNIFKNV